VILVVPALWLVTTPVDELTVTIEALAEDHAPPVEVLLSVV
jgi:hypothetical protein